MNGFDEATRKAATDASSGLLSPSSDLTAEQIAAYVAEAHRLRAQYISDGVRHFLRTVASLRRPRNSRRLIARTAH
jgi:hypothetical protein